MATNTIIFLILLVLLVLSVESSSLLRHEYLTLDHGA